MSAPGLAGSWAVGCAWSSLPPRISDVRVGRELVIGGGLPTDALGVDLGGAVASVRAALGSGVTPLDPIHGLQNAMREAEAHARAGDPARGDALSWSSPTAR